MLRALWQPRLIEAIGFVEEEMVEGRAEGRTPLVAELKGAADVFGVRLSGMVDRLDRCAGGRLAIIDYKTGKPPSRKAVDEGFSLQLGLLGLIARAGGFEGVTGEAGRFEYWSLAKDKGKFGHIVKADVRSGMEPDEFVETAARHFAAAVARWLTGVEPFTAKLHPEYAPYGEYDQLMRLDEWYGR
jgi:ATP-dependent helicase/nuclease subunit B